jgi:hypothetical protein
MFPSMAKQTQSKLLEWLTTMKDDRIGKAAVIANDSGMGVVILIDSNGSDDTTPFTPVTTAARGAAAPAALQDQSAQFPKLIDSVLPASAAAAVPASDQDQSVRTPACAAAAVQAADQTPSVQTLELIVPHRRGSLHNCSRMLADCERNLAAWNDSIDRENAVDARTAVLTAAATAAADAAAAAPYQSNTDDSDGPISRGARRAAIAVVKRRRVIIDDATPTPSPPNGAAGAEQPLPPADNYPVQNPTITIEQPLSPADYNHVQYPAITIEQTLSAADNYPVQNPAIKIMVGLCDDTVYMRTNCLRRLPSFMSMADPSIHSICGKQCHVTTTNSWTCIPLTSMNPRIHHRLPAITVRN